VARHRLVNRALSLAALIGWPRYGRDAELAEDWSVVEARRVVGRGADLCGLRLDENRVRRGVAAGRADVD
jgi:hypothetical protein